MGFSCGLVFASKSCGSSAKDVASALALIAPGSSAVRVAPLGESGDDGQIAALELEHWYVLFGDVRPFLMSGLSDRLSFLSTKGKIFCAISESTSGGLGFELHEHGRPLRRWLEVEGVVVANEGPALEEEPAGLFTADFDEDGEREFWELVSVAERVTGTNWDAFQELPAEVHPASS